MPKPFVLIVEDERDIAALFRHVMDMAGYRTEIAANGQLALERLATVQPDIVLLDLSLPRISGTTVLQTMRADERIKDIPVIVITAYYELANELAVEPDLIMLKPVSPQQLITLVERLRRDRLHMDLAPLQGAPWDEITGLYNRSFFTVRLDSAVRSMKENGQNLFAVLSLAPGRYDDILQRFGQKQADDFLRTMAASLKASVRPTDTVARFEGDRFFLLIEQAPGLRIPEMIAARIRDRLKERPVEAGGSGDCSIAVLLCDARYADAGEILRDSQAACARVQAATEGSCLTFDHDSIISGHPTA